MSLSKDYVYTNVGISHIWFSIFSAQSLVWILNDFSGSEELVQSTLSDIFYGSAKHELPGAEMCWTSIDSESRD